MVSIARVSSSVRPVSVRYTAEVERAPTVTAPPTKRITREDALRTLVASPLWAAAGPTERPALLRLLDRMNGELTDVHTTSGGTTTSQTGYDAFVSLCRAKSGGAPVLLMRGGDGRSVLDMLGTLSVDPRVLQKVAPVKEADVLAGLMLELADPGRIDQSGAGTCTVTSMQVSLATYEPVEYTRIMVGLLSAAASVKLRGGEILHRDDNGIAPSSSTVSTRTPSERVFQAAMIQARVDRDYTASARGEGWAFNEREIDTLPLAMKIIMWILLPFGLLLTLMRHKGYSNGLDDSQIQAAASELFGRKYGVHSLNDDDDELAWFRRHAPDGDFRGKGIILSLSPFGDSAHALLLERADYTSSPPAIICRNPWGSEPNSKAGAHIGHGAPEDIVWDDPKRATVLIKLTKSNRARLNTVHYPTA